MEKCAIICMLVLAHLRVIDTVCEEPSPQFCNSMKRYCNVPGAESYLRLVCPIACGYCKGGLVRDDTPTLAPGRFNPPYTGVCGLSQVMSSRIIAGTTAVKGSWPWQILLMKMGEKICGGTLISLQWVVTAAHCVSGSENNPYYITVRVGEYRLAEEDGSEDDIIVKKIIIHPRFNWLKINNDIALLKLSRPVRLNRFVSPACLPSINPTVGMKCFITGWGQMRYPGDMAPVLQQGLLPVVSNDACDEKNKKVIPIIVTPNMICAGSGGSSRLAGCHGDSGGPFVCHIGGRWELHGTVSHGSPICNSTETYTVFSRTRYFKDWIEDTMARN